MRAFGRIVAVLALLLAHGAPSAPAAAQTAAVERVGWYNAADGSGVFVVGSYAYLGTTGGLQVLDVSDPGFPKLVATVGPTGFRATRPLALYGRYLYANGGGGSMVVFDLADPARPVAVELGLRASEAMAIGGAYGYLAQVETFTVVDLASPTSPVVLREIPYAVRSGQQAWDVAVVGQYAYVAEYLAGLAVYDVSDPRNPRRAGSSTPLSPSDVTAVGNYLYAAGRVLSLTDPTYPYEVGTYLLGGQFVGAEVANGRLYVAEAYLTGDPMQGGGLRVFDVADPARPRELAFRPSEQPTGVSVAGDLVYVADQERGLLALRYPGQAAPAQRVRAYLPLVLNEVPWVAAPGTFVSSVTVQNAGTARTNVTVRLVDRTGALVRERTFDADPGGTVFYYVPQHFQNFGGPPLPAGQYAAIVSADQPVLAVLNVMGDGPPMAASYTGLPAEDAARTVYLPAVYTGYFGYDATVTVQNTAASPANVTLRYRDQSGTVVRTDSAQGVPGGGFQVFDAGRGGPFVGSAVVEADQPVVVAVHVAHAAGELAAYTGVTVGGGTTMPVLYKNYSPAGWTSSVLVQNLDLIAADVDLAGESASIPPGATRQFYLANTAQPDGLLAATTLQTGRRLAAVVMTRNAAGNLSGQNGLRRGATLLHLPALYSEYSPLRWASSFVLHGAGSVVGTYYRFRQPIRTFEETLTFGETRLHYQPNEGLPPEFNGSAEIRATSGSVNAVANNLALGQTGGDWLLTYESFQPPP